MLRVLAGVIVGIVTMAALVACATAHPPQVASCGPADVRATNMRLWIVRMFTEPGMQVVRRNLHLPDVPADGILQVSDNSLCARVATALSNRLNVSPPAMIYLFRARNRFVLVFPDDPTTEDEIHFLTDSLVYLGTGIR